MTEYLYKPYSNKQYADFVVAHQGRKLCKDSEKVWFEDYPTPSLVDLKLAKCAEINRAREKARLEEYAEYDNDRFDIDETSQSNILAQIKVAELLQNDKATYVYRSKTNQSHLFNVYQLQELGLLIAQKVSEIYMRSWDLKAKIDAAETIEEVNAIEWYDPSKEVESAS